MLCGYQGGAIKPVPMVQSFFRPDFRPDDTILDEFVLQEQTGHPESRTSGTIVKDAGDDNPWRKRPAFSAAIRLEAKKQFYTKSG